MKALLWKDYRVNRLVLIVGLALLVAPFIVGATWNLCDHWRYDAVHPWPDFIANLGLLTLVLSLLTIALLGGNAIAGERMDRSAEFLAYLPASRRAVLTSKAVLAVGASLLLWLAIFAVIYGVAPLAGSLAEDVIRDVRELPWALTCIAVFVFGTAWLFSSFLNSPAIAAALGIAAPIMLFIIMGILVEWFGFAIANVWYFIICVVAGLICFAAGTGYYLWRVEP